MDHVLGSQIAPPYTDGFERLLVGMGCSWGAERIFWRAPGVHTTAVGYAGGTAPSPTYDPTQGNRQGNDLAKNPNGYCGLGSTGVACPVGLGPA